MSDRPDSLAPAASMLDAARIVARGGPLDTKLATLAEHARTATGAAHVSIHLIDAEGTGLVPAGRLTPAEGDGSVDETHEPAAGPSRLTLEGAHPAVRTALEDRVAVSFVNDADALASLPFLPDTARGVAAIPLVTADHEGAAVVEGLLLWAGADEIETAPEAVMAVADLVAVAIRQTRLENALTEHADWIDRVANTDPLTGLANRRTFERMLQLELVRASRQAGPIGLALFAVDGLAELEAQTGAAAADDVLRRVAATLADQLRLIDTVARIGPGTFAAICPGAQGTEAATRVRDAVARLGPAPTGPVSVTVGVVRFPDEGNEADQLLAAGEAVLEAAGAQGPGTVLEPTARR
ncbi:MAG: GGDEF domain-containing protein [Chloroflexota bacterium]|nr:GGDEF domain-containing protein [Chloroflexota bacterium]